MENQAESFALPQWQELPGFGLYLDQVLGLTAAAWGTAAAPLTAGMVNSYVKSGLVERPEKKKYSRAALAQLIMITFLKQTSSMDSLQALLHPADGTDAEEIYSRFLLGYREVNVFLSEHPELTGLDCALAAAVCQTRVRTATEGQETAPQL